jgi:hypothetical protein
VVAALFSRLAAEEIRYCHWKSNEHLRPATLGETDLDILVDRSDALRLSQALAGTGYKRFAAPAETAYPGIEDYLALDGATGKLVHLHVHYRLILGEKFLKGYRIPWERVLLSGRVLDPETALYTSSPEGELVVLTVRAALKLRNRDLFGAARTLPGLGDDVAREFRWLAERVHRDRVRTLAIDLLGPWAEPLLLDLLDSGLTRGGLVKFRRAIDPVMQPYRGFRPAQARRLRWTREWRVRWTRLWGRVFVTRRALRLCSPRGGLVVAFLGADGSGKSTLTQVVASWLGWKLEVLPLYFGFGDGPVSPARRPLRLLQVLYARGRRSRKQLGARGGAGMPGSVSVPGWRGTPRSVWRLLHAWSIVREKRGRLYQAQRARYQGGIVIADRYPQGQVMSFGDGPLLASWAAHRWSVLRAIARWELEAYRRMEAVTPDLVIKLHVSPAMSALRKPGDSIDSLAPRAETVRRIHFPEETRVVDLDADQPLETVLMRVKEAVWEAL